MNEKMKGALAERVCQVITYLERDYLFAVDNNILGEPTASNVFKDIIERVSFMLAGQDWKEVYGLALDKKRELLDMCEQELNMYMTVLTAKKIINGKE